MRRVLGGLPVSFIRSNVGKASRGSKMKENKTKSGSLNLNTDVPELLGIVQSNVQMCMNRIVFA